jgi:hypothetical protein
LQITAVIATPLPRAFPNIVISGDIDVFKCITLNVSLRPDVHSSKIKTVAALSHNLLTRSRQPLAGGAFRCTSNLQAAREYDLKILSKASRSLNRTVTTLPANVLARFPVQVPASDSPLDSRRPLYSLQDTSHANHGIHTRL